MANSINNIDSIDSIDSIDTDIEPLLDRPIGRPNERWVDFEKLEKFLSRRRTSRLSWRRSGFWMTLVVSLLLLAVGTGNIVVTYFRPIGLLDRSGSNWLEYIFSGITLTCAIVLLLSTSTPDRVTLVVA